MDCAVRPSVASDVAWVANNIREEDKLDLEGIHAADALRLGLELSTKCYTLTVNHVPAAMFGVNNVPEMGYVGAVWLLGTPLIERAWVYVARNSRKWLEVLEEGFVGTMNRLHEGNSLHRRWLEWLGYRGVEQIGSFIVFVKETKCVIP